MASGSISLNYNDKPRVKFIEPFTASDDNESGPPIAQTIENSPSITRRFSIDIETKDCDGYVTMPRISFKNFSQDNRLSSTVDKRSPLKEPLEDTRKSAALPRHLVTTFSSPNNKLRLEIAKMVSQK